MMSSRTSHNVGHGFAPYSGKGSSTGRGHPIMYGFADAENFDPFPDGGGYPQRFLAKVFDLIGCTDPSRVLHLCSGSMRSGTTVDIRPECNPTVVCDARRTPFAAESFDFVMIDPPYSKEYAENLYGTGDVYPEPRELLAEAARVLRWGGTCTLLHFMVPMARKPLKIRAVKGITFGAGYAIRALTILEKDPTTVFGK